MSEKHLIVIEDLTPEKIYSPGGMQPILDEIQKKAQEHKPDVTTLSGRKKIASNAAKVASSKTLLDKMGKELKSQYKKLIDPIDAERKLAREFLDSLKADVRKPLTEWEEQERTRVENHKKRLDYIITLPKPVDDAGIYLHSSVLEGNYKTLEDIKIDETWEEFEGDASKAKLSSLTRLKGMISEAQKREEQERELAALKAAEEARLLKEKKEAEQAEQERKIKEAEEQAAAKAKQEAEEKLRAAHLEAERQKKAAEQAERERIEALERVHKEKEAAIQAEKDRVAAEKEKLEREKLERENDYKHKQRTNNAILSALNETCNISVEVGKEIIRAVVMDKIPNLKIEY